MFSGIGGWELAARWTWQDKHEILSFVERDKYCQKVLNKNFPGVPIIGEIAECDGTKFDSVELITGSPPCQPFSVAGKRKGKEDDRHLWPEMLRIIREAKPRWVCVENVAGLAGMVLDEMLDDLESASFEAQTFLIPACSVGANHRRDRIWIVAHNTDSGNGDRIGQVQRGQDTEPARVHVPHAKRNRLQGSRKEWNIARQIGLCGGAGSDEERILSHTASGRTKRGGARSDERGFQNTALSTMGDRNNWSVEPAVGRVVNGLPHRVDRLRGLGNAIVPQVAREILEAIKQTEAVLCE